MPSFLQESVSDIGLELFISELMLFVCGISTSFGLIHFVMSVHWKQACGFHVRSKSIGPSVLEERLSTSPKPPVPTRSDTQCRQQAFHSSQTP